MPLTLGQQKGSRAQNLIGAREDIPSVINLRKRFLLCLYLGDARSRKTIVSACRPCILFRERIDMNACMPSLDFISIGQFPARVSTHQIKSVLRREALVGFVVHKELLVYRTTRLMEPWGVRIMIVL